MAKKYFKNPWLAVFLTTIYPGLGHLYSDKKGKGFYIMLLYMIFYFIFFYIVLSENVIINSFYFFLLLPFSLLWIYILVDAYLSAKIFNKKNNIGFSQSLLEKIISVIIILIFFMFVRNSLFGNFVKNNIVQAYKKSSDAMAPTLLKNDRVLAKKNYFLKNYIPNRFDIVIFKTPHGKEYIKRIIGLPGETIEIKTGKVLINGKSLDLPNDMKGIQYKNEGDFGNVGKVFKIPADNYYILGDGNESVDSRFFGFISRSDIIGKTYKIYYPFNRAKKL